MKRSAFFIIFIFSVISLHAADLPDYEMDTKMKTMFEAEPPVFFRNQILLSYESSDFTRMVGAAFEHENYSRIHVFWRNQFNVFVALIPVPPDVDELKYRLIVDGLWIHDPVNPDVLKDKSGLRVSMFKIPEKTSVNPASPLIDDGTVVFTYRGAPGKSVFISGDFNNWNPFIYQMNEAYPGTYTLSLELPPGRYYYCYYENGEKKLDMLNPNFATNSENQAANFFNIM